MKIGDIVKHTQNSGWKNCPHWGFPGKVVGIYPYENGPSSISIQMLDGPDKGRIGGFSEDQLELVDVNKSMTDQELADSYRKLRAEGMVIAKELIDRGYTIRGYDSQLDMWLKLVVLKEPMEFRIEKTETTTTTL